MSVVFCFSFIRVHVYVFPMNFMVHCGSASSRHLWASLLLHTTPPVTVPDVTSVRTVWRPNTNNIYIHIYIYIYIYIYLRWCSTICGGVQLFSRGGLKETRTDYACMCICKHTWIHVHEYICVNNWIYVYAYGYRCIQTFELAWRLQTASELHLQMLCLLTVLDSARQWRRSTIKSPWLEAAVTI